MCYPISVGGPPTQLVDGIVAEFEAEFSTFEAAHVREGLDNATVAALTGAKSPEEALAEAQAAADRLLQPISDRPRGVGETPAPVRPRP